MMFKSQPKNKFQCGFGIWCLCLFVIWNLVLGIYLRDSYAQTISSTELINNTKQYDNKTVVYKGEVIGDVMQRGNYAWINVNDGKNAIGIWLPVNLTKEIAYTGSYKSIGDEIEITGVFHRACPEHGGDLDIHAQVIRKIDSGKPVQDKLNTSKRNQAIVLLGILGLVWILTLFKHK